MGYDVSYHPISPSQMADWYVGSLASDEHAAAVCDRAGMHELYKQKFIDYLPQFRQAHSSAESFDTTHGFFIAVTQGFFAKFHYVRGAMLSEVGDTIAPYAAPWSETLPELLGTIPAHDRIVTNYSSGVYIPPAHVAPLLVAVRTDTAMQAALAPVFHGEHLSILVAALHEAEQLGVGLLEATDMIEPNPLDLESTHCLANLFNCDTAGPMLYQKTAQEQLGNVAGLEGLDIASLVANGQIERVRVDVDSATGETTMAPAPTRTGPEQSPRPSAPTQPSTGGFFSRFRRSK